MSEERKGPPPPRKPENPPPPPRDPISDVLGGEGIRGEVLGCPTGCSHPLAEAMSGGKKQKPSDEAEGKTE